MDQSRTLADIEGMAIDSIKQQGVSTAAVSHGAMKLPDGVPQMSLEDVQAVVRRSRHAAHLKAHLDECLHNKGAFSRGEVKDLLARAGGTGKHADGDQAVVLAYYAQNHAEIFAPDAHALVSTFLADVDWASLMADLKKFIADLEAKEVERKKAEQLKQQLLEDDLKRDGQQRDLVKQNGTAADRKKDLQKREAHKAAEKQKLREASPADLDDELTGSGRLNLNDVELAKLKLLKKGFANRD